MSNSNYAQVSSLLAAGKLHWQTDAISAVLLTGASFDPAHTVISDTGGTIEGLVPVMGRALVESNAMGQPVIFPAVKSSAFDGDGSPVTDDEGEPILDDEDRPLFYIDYQMALIQSNNVSEPVLLAWIDENQEAGEITVVQDGTLIVRPVLTDDYVAPDGTVLPPQVGVWMTL